MGTEFTPEEIAEEEVRRRRDNNPYPQRVGRKPKPTPDPELDALDTSGGVPTCPKCGGTQFKARRTVKQRFGIAAVGALTLPISAGAGALAASKGMKQRVQCITCGTFYARIQ